jgi:hypothetical protein
MKSAFARTAGERIDAVLDQAGAAGACPVLRGRAFKKREPRGPAKDTPMHPGERTSSVSASMAIHSVMTQ